MLRRSSRLQARAGGHGNESLDDSSQKSSSSYISTRREAQMSHSRKQQSNSSSSSSSPKSTPRKTLSFSAVNIPINSSVQGSSSTSDVAMVTSVLDQTHPRQSSVTSTTVDGLCGKVKQDSKTHTGCLPKVWKLLLLLLAAAVWWWGPSAGFLLTHRPATNLPVPASYLLPTSVPVSDPQTLLTATPVAPFSQAPSGRPPTLASSFDVERLERLEGQLVLLWERVQQGDREQDQNLGDLLGLYSSLKEQLANLEVLLMKTEEFQVQAWAGSTLQTVTPAADGLTEQQVTAIVQNALKMYSQDRTGQVDYALESLGGSILSTHCSETHGTKTSLLSLFGWRLCQAAHAVIQPDVYPGNCWAFKGSQGYLAIRLSMRILPTSFSVEHIPKTLSPTGNITSAPRDFTVFGLDEDHEEQGSFLGSYTYQEDGETLQTFHVMGNDKAFQVIEVRVLSNWGHPDYTCLYRFRVHGKPHTQ